METQYTQVPSLSSESERYNMCGTRQNILVQHTMTKTFSYNCKTDRYEKDFDGSLRNGLDKIRHNEKKGMNSSS